jgi:hypothetical protein
MTSEKDDKELLWAVESERIQRRAHRQAAAESLYGTEAKRLSDMRYMAVGPDDEMDLARIADDSVPAIRWSRAKGLLLAGLVGWLTDHPLAFPAALVVYLLSRLIDVVLTSHPGYRQQLYSSVISQELALRNILVEVRKLAGAPEDDRRP